MSLKDYEAQYKKLPMKRNLKGEEALEEVTRNGLNLEYVEEQTEEICEASVTQNGMALKFVMKQTKRICEIAVKNTIRALQYVEERFFKE